MFARKRFVLSRLPVPVAGEAEQVDLRDEGRIGPRVLVDEIAQPDAKFFAAPASVAIANHVPRMPIPSHVANHMPPLDEAFQSLFERDVERQNNPYAEQGDELSDRVDDLARHLARQKRSSVLARRAVESPGFEKMDQSTELALENRLELDVTDRVFARNLR